MWNCHDAHWVCARYSTNISCKQNIVKVYDSWRTFDVTTDQKKQLLIHCRSRVVIKEYLFLKFSNKIMERSSCGHALV